MMGWLKNLQSVLTSLCGLTLVASIFLPDSILPYLSAAFGSYFALKAAYGSVKDRSIDVNFLMVFAAIGSVAVGHVIEAAVLLFLFSLSSTLESYAMARTKSAIEGLVKLRPDSAIRLGADGEEVVAVKDLQVGDVVRVPAFEQIPVDGEVVSGVTSVNQSAMTGESEPVSRSVGDRVLAGTQNLDGIITVTVTAALGDTTLEKIVDLVQEAQEHKASGERISHWFGQRYTFFVIGAFVLSYLVRVWLGQAQSDALYAALTLLVALSPCALVISTPASTLSALAWAARHGLLIRGGAFIEEVARVDAIAIDKTGTLTLGRPKLVEICVCAPTATTVGGGGACKEEEACWHGKGGFSDQALFSLRVAASAEQYSTHPVAEAIVHAAREAGIEVPEASEQTAHPGLGVTATVEGHKVKIGQRRFFESQPGGLSKEFIPHIEELHEMGLTVVVLEHDGNLAALGLRDEPRPAAKAVLQELRSLGVKHLAMVTGDTQHTADAVAADLPLDAVHAGLMPQEKAEIVEKMMAEGRRVMMVGDGVNDAPVLAASHVGVAMGGLGSDVALNAADIVLMHDRLESLPSLVKLGRMTGGIIKANLIFSTAMILTLAIGTFAFAKLSGGHNNLMLPLAVVGHEGSTVLVILNGLRLLRGPK